METQALQKAIERINQILWDLAVMIEKNTNEIDKLKATVKLMDERLINFSKKSN